MKDFFSKRDASSSVKRVVLLGKTNVGKSSLYNALTKGPASLVSAKEHVTRDALIAPLHLPKNRRASDLNFSAELVDLAGFDFQKTDFVQFNRPRTDFFIALKEHMQKIIDQADLIVAVFDLTDITGIDREMVKWLKDRLEDRQNKGVKNRKKDLLKHPKYSKKAGNQSVFYVFNKVDNQKQMALIAEAYELGIDENDLLLVSVKSNWGLDKLTETIWERLQKSVSSSEKSKLTAAPVEEKKATLSGSKDGEVEDAKSAEESTSKKDRQSKKKQRFTVALVGKPNAGKSSLFNSLLNSYRVLVSDMPGTTRDSISGNVTWKNCHLKLIDTAGIRRKSKKKDEIEEFSIDKSIGALTKSDLTLLLVDATAPISDQDKKIANVAVKRGKVLIILFNKWDLVKQSWKRFVDRQLFLFPLLSRFVLLPLSTKTGYQMPLLKERILQFAQLSEKTFSTSLLNRVLQQAFKQTPPPSRRISTKRAVGQSNKKHSANARAYTKLVFFKPLYAVLLSTLPFVVKIFCHHPRAITPAYESYLITSFRKAFLIEGVPIRLIFEESRKKQEEILKKEELSKNK